MFGDKSVRVLGPPIWNMLAAELKRQTSYEQLKRQFKN